MNRLLGYKPLEDMFNEGEKKRESEEFQCSAYSPEFHSADNELMAQSRQCFCWVTAQLTSVCVCGKLINLMWHNHAFFLSHGMVAVISPSFIIYLHFFVVEHESVFGESLA